MVLKQHLEELKSLSHERKLWLMLSALIITIVIFFIFGNNSLRTLGLLWPVAVSGILLCVIWWYWVMRLIRILMEQRREETEVLIDICQSVKDIREDVRKSFPN